MQRVVEHRIVREMLMNYSLMIGIFANDMYLRRIVRRTENRIIILGVVQPALRGVNGWNPCGSVDMLRP